LHGNNLGSIYISIFLSIFLYVVVQPLSHFWHSVTPKDMQASMSFTNSEFTQTHVHWVGDAIQPSHPLLPPFSSCPHSFPASGSFPMSWLIASGGQSIGASASASILPMNIQGWFPLGLTGLISLPSKGLSKVFSSTTIQRYWFFSTQPRNNMNPHEPINLRTPSVPLNFKVYPYSLALLPLVIDFFFPLYPLAMLPDQGLNPHPWQWKHKILSTGLPRNSWSLLLKYSFGFH